MRERTGDEQADGRLAARAARSTRQDPSSDAIAYAVDHRTGPVAAQLAPDQDEAHLPHRPLDAPPLSRADIVSEALDVWATEVAGSSTGTSFLTDLRGGDHVLDLTHSHPSGLAQLLAGRGATRLSSLVREVGALADARAHARAIRETAERMADEIGLTTCHLAIGEASWSPVAGGRPVHAPVLLRPITLRLRGNAREDVELDLDATVDLNPVLLRSLREAGVAVDARALLATTDSPYGFDPNPVLDAFRALGEALPGFRVRHALVVGNLVDTAGPLVDDLERDRHDWVDHPLVAALAGHDGARSEIAAASTAGEDEPAPLPESELVAAVDPDRQEALRRVLAGGHLALTSPPGTDPLDLVIELAAELNARGRSVLVVSQRRRTLGQLVAQAEQRGLQDLLFDLSPDPALQRNASASLLHSLRRAGSFQPPVSTEEPAELAEAREVLSGHVAAMHRVQQPWNASAHEAISALAALTRLRPAPRTGVRLRAEVAAAMVGEERERFADMLREAAEAGVLRSGPETTAWHGAAISSETQAERAADLVDQLRTSLLPALRRHVTATGSAIGLQDADSLADLVPRLSLLDRVRTVLGVLQPAVFEADLEQLVAATGDKRWREEHGVALGWGARRSLRKEAVGLQRPAALAPDLHGTLQEARHVRDMWRRSSLPSDTRLPSVPEDVEAARTVVERTQRVYDELAVLLDGSAAGGDLAGTPFDEIAQRMDALHRDRASLVVLPRQTTLLRRLDFDGLGELVEDLRSRKVAPGRVGAELELAWWSSVLELIAAAEPTISQYDGTSLSQVAERFRRLDAEHLRHASYRVRAASDDVLVSTMKEFPDTSRAAIAELARSSTVSVRDLAAKYEDILFRARPTWLASPYLVPQIVPRGRHFDVVIVADGGRLPVSAGLPAIVRAGQTVVVGDPLEYPGPGVHTLLDAMLGVAGHLPMRRDTRAASEGVRAFSQRRSICSPVLAVPTPVGVEPDRLIAVENGTGAVIAGAEYVESTEAELRRVTDLVVEHARTRPERSLAVLTLTAEHAHRVMERVMQTVAVIPGLRDFFDPATTEFFTVLPAARASTIVRDDVIVSIGFGKTPHGRLLHRFGPLSAPDGRKALASVLTRARGRTLVVSALQAEDLDLTRLRSDGARDLRNLLQYLSGGEDELDPASVGAVPAVEDETAPTEPDADTGPNSTPTTAAAPEVSAEDAFDAQLEAALAAGPRTAPGPEGEESGTVVEADPDETPEDGGATTPPRDEDAASPEESAQPQESPDAAGQDAPARGSGNASVGAAAPPAAGDVADIAPDSDAVTAEPSAGAADREATDRATTGTATADGESPDAASPDGEPTEGASPDDAPDDEEAAGPEDEEPASRELETGALLADLADRLWRHGLHVASDYGLTEDRIELALGHPELPGRYLVAIDTDGERYVATPSQRERDRLRAERLEAAGWATERVWSWALFIDPEGESERIRRAVDRALLLARSEEQPSSPSGVGTVRKRLPRPQIPAGHPLSFYGPEDFDVVVEYICSDGRARLEDQLAAEVREFLGFDSRSVLLDVSVASAIRRYQERQ